MFDCGWCNGEGASDWVYQGNDATALEAYLPDELALVVRQGAKIVRGEECEECEGKGEVFVDDDGHIALTDAIFAYESGELPIRDMIIMFARLIETSMCWSLQGSYGRMGQSFIEEGVISTEGVIDWDVVNSKLVEVNS